MIIRYINLNAPQTILSTPSTSIEKWSLPAFLVSLVSVGLPLLMSPCIYSCTLGEFREVKKAVEAYWAGKQSSDELLKAIREVKKTSWTSVKEHGVDYIPRCVIAPSIASLIYR